MKPFTIPICAAVAVGCAASLVVVAADAATSPPLHATPLAAANDKFIVKLTTDVTALNTRPVGFAGKVVLKGGASCDINGSLAVVKAAIFFDDRVQVSALPGTTMLCPGWPTTRHVDGNFVPLAGAVGWQPPQTVVSVAPQYNGSTQYSSRNSASARLGYRFPAGTLGTWTFFQTIDP
jgi:hypothetical protein